MLFPECVHVGWVNRASYPVCTGEGGMQGGLEAGRVPGTPFWSVAPMVPAMLESVMVKKTCHRASESLSKAVSPLVSVGRGFLGVMCPTSRRVG